jgi:hypothetical protein
MKKTKIIMGAGWFIFFVTMILSYAFSIDGAPINFFSGFGIGLALLGIFKTATEYGMQKNQAK